MTILRFLIACLVATAPASRLAAESEPPAPPAPADAPATETEPASPKAPPAEESAPQPAAEATKPCFQCNGTKQAKCGVSTCVQGQMECPGPCLKLSTPGWKQMNMPGHKPDELWMEFRHDDASGYQAFSQKHVGEVVKKKNGRAVTEKCAACKGKARVACTTCKGSGISTCTMCRGSGKVPQSWTAEDNPKMKNRPSRFKLKDGSEIVGRKTIESQDEIMVRTENGVVRIKKTDLLPAETPSR